MPQFSTHSSLARTLYFWSGIIATVAYRIIIVLTNIDQFWIKLSWYIGTVGFVIYFAHRYQISERRNEIIHKQKLKEKVLASSELATADKEALSYILFSLESSKEKWNYIVIFATSAVALLAGLYLDFLS